MIRLFATAALLSAALLIQNPEALAVEEAWIHFWNGPSSSNDDGRLGVFDAEGSVYMVGTTRNTETTLAYEDFFVTKLNADGAVVWTRIFGEDYNDIPAAAAMTPNGDIAILVANNGIERKLVTLVLDTDGNTLWEDSRLVVGPASPNITPDLVVDGDGNLTIAGVDQERMLVRRLSGAGTVIYDTYLPDLGIFKEIPTGLAVDAAGNTFVAGMVMGLDGDNAHGLFKLDPAGVHQWHHTDIGNFGGIFEYAEVAVGPDGHPVMVSNPESNCGLFEERITKLDAATGAVLWMSVLNDEPCEVFVPTSMAMDEDGSIFVGSFGRVAGATNHMQVVKWSADGDLLWYNEYSPENTYSGKTVALELDAAGSVYATGYVTYGAQDTDFATLKYNAAGDLEWSQRWGGDRGANDWPRDLAVSSTGKVAVFGLGFFGLPNNNDAVAVMYEPAGLAPVIPGPPAADQSVHALLNPFSASTRIRFAVGQSTDYKLSVFDVRGRRVKSLGDGHAVEGSHEIAWSGRDDAGRVLPSGVYLVTLETRLGVTTQRVGLVR